MERVALLLAVALGPAGAAAASGTVYAMGGNTWPPGAFRAVPSLTQVRTGVGALDAAETHWVCLAGGEAMTVGSNTYGQLGDGTSTDRNKLEKVADDVQAVSAGVTHTLFLLSDGSVLATGRNDIGQLGDGTTVDKLTPVTLAVENITRVSAGPGRHSAFLKDDGTVLTTGLGNNGQLGHDPEYGTATLNPQQVDSPIGVQAVSVGGFHTVLLGQDGTVWVTGLGTSGQLGLGESVSEIGRGQTPVALGVNGSNVQAIAAGKFVSFFLAEDGMAWGTGWNVFGTLGDGSTENRFTPVPVLGGVQSVSCWDEHAVFLKSDGSVYVTGRNGYGELGRHAHVDARNDDGELVYGDISVPTQVAISNTTASYAFAGNYYSLFVSNDDLDVLSVSVVGRACLAGTPVNGTENALQASMSHQEQRSVQCDVGYYGAVTVECLNGAPRVLDNSCVDSCDTPTPVPTLVPTPIPTRLDCSADDGEDDLQCQGSVLKVVNCSDGEVGVKFVNCSAEGSQVIVNGCTPACTDAPTPAPTDAPTPAPTDAPTPAPTDAPTPAPTDAPTPAPTDAPTPAPTDAPTPAPTDAPTPAPTDAPPPAGPAGEPTATPTPAPTAAAATSSCESGGVVSVDGADVDVTASLEHGGQRSVACPAGSLGAVVVECWNGSMRVFSHDCSASPAPTDAPSPAAADGPTAAATSGCESGGVVRVHAADVNVTASLEHEGQRSVACPAGSLGAVAVECWNGSLRVFSHDCSASPASLVEDATTVQQPIEQGSVTIFLSSSAGFAVGDRIRISGCGYSEARTIVGIGSIHLDSPLAYPYPEGTAVLKEPALDVDSDQETLLIAVETVTIVLAGALVFAVCCCAMLFLSWRSAVRRLRSCAEATETRIKELEASLEKQHGPIAHQQPTQTLPEELLEEPPIQNQFIENSPQDLQERAHPETKNLVWETHNDDEDDENKDNLDPEPPEKISFL